MSPRDGGRLGAPHAADIPLVFDNVAKPGSRAEQPVGHLPRAELGVRDDEAAREQGREDQEDGHEVLRSAVRSTLRHDATVARRLSTVCVWYGYLEAEELIERDPAKHVRRPKVSMESTTLGLDRAQLGAMLYTAERARPTEYALVCLLGLNGLRVTEACEAEITSPSDAAIARSPEMRNSRATITTTTHTATRPSRTSITSAESTITLSDSGSRNFPSVVTLSETRASQPSNQSVSAHTA